MRFHLVAVGTRMPDWVRAGFDDYARRLHGGARLALHEVAATARRGAAAEPGKARAEEAQRLRKALPARARVVALDVGGRALDTETLAGRLREWNRDGTEVAFLVGGPDGLDPDLLGQADERWSLSALTLPHALVRIVLAEQLYRALSILHNHPYHR
ncbi:MAG: 23S rRNA (pseudouridine(1915)-N(3))-methyltransferase RlmH [Halofilum sp. (in: g-proteobacteria)]|nr:23S rRNA (pseudouridine(1915)-N(3))-methyltransferase RlmH [Halofilum sp. (in: g-proteobacteria)]